jgi:hypothetical protein
MYSISTTIKKFLSGWEPTSVFYDNYCYNTIWDIWATRYTYTKLGQFFEDAPTLLSVLKLCWYIPAWPIYCISNFVWFTIELFFPRKIKDLL